MLGFLALSAILAAAPAPGEDPRADRAYFLVSFRGHTIGKAERVLRLGGKPGEPLLVLTAAEDYRFAAGDRPAAASSLRRAATMRLDWRPVVVSESEADGTGKRWVKFEAGAAVFHLGEGRTKRVPHKGLVLAELGGEALAARGLLKVGGELAAAVPDLAQAGLVPLRARVIGEKTVEGREGRLFLIGVKYADGRDAWDLLVDGRGRLVERSAGDMLRRRVRREEAVLPDRPAALAAGVIPLAGAPERFHLLKSMTVELQLPEVAKGLVPDLAGQRVSEAGRRLTVKLLERRPDGSLPRQELSAAERKMWLESEREPDWRDEKISKLAAAITGGARSDLRKGYLVGKWVHRNLVKSLGGPPEASARRALAARSGDCSEHAALFAALCRAAGLPARTAYGLAGARGALRFHVWSEYYAGGRWVPLDAAVGRYGLPACYIVLSYDREAGGERLFKLYAAARGKVLAAEERSPRRRPERP